MKSDRPPVSVVVPTRDRPDLLAQCLRALRRSLRPEDELVVVDSASRDAASVAEIAANAEARLVRCDQPGVNRARNAGWHATRHALLLFTDDDVVVDETWADMFATVADEQPQAAFITGWISTPTEDERRWDVAVKEDAEPTRLTAATPGTLGHSASLAVRRQDLDAVGGWDEALGAGGHFPSAPEVDLFDRMFASGREGWFDPRVRAWHHQWRTTAQVIPLHYRYGVGSGARIAKLLRTDRPRARTVAWLCLWSWGLLQLGQRVRELDKAGSLVVTARMAGYVTGFVRGVGTPVRDGHYRPRSS